MDIIFDYTTDTISIEGESIVTIKAVLKEATLWAGKGYPVASEQFVIKDYDYPSSLKTSVITPKTKKDKAAARMPNVKKVDGGYMVATERGSIVIKRLLHQGLLQRFFLL